jgi:hypothetical protein
MVANCAVAVDVALIEFMVARARFLRYPNLAGNSDFRRNGCCETNCPKEPVLWLESALLGPQKGRFGE